MSQDNKFATSLPDYTQKVQELFSTQGDYIYRGLYNSKFKCKSSARVQLDLKNHNNGITRKKFFDYHYDLVRRYIELDPQHLNIKALSTIEKLADLQHYEAPTLLIDFSKDCLVALHYAVKTLKDEKGNIVDGKVLIANIKNKNIFENLFYCLDDNSSGNSIKSDLEKLIRDKSDKLRFWTPPKINDRIPVNKSIFIIDETHIPDEYFQEIIISKDHKQEIAQQLKRMCDIDSATLTNDLSGFSKSFTYDEEINN